MKGLADDIEVERISYKITDVDAAVREIETKGYGFNFKLRNCPEKAMRDAIEKDFNTLVPQLIMKHGGQLTIESAAAGGNGGNVTLDHPEAAKTIGEQVADEAAEKRSAKGKKDAAPKKNSTRLAKGKRNRERRGE